MQHREKFFMGYCLPLIMVMIFGCALRCRAEALPWKVLYLASYHEGYKWSDDIYQGIKSQFIFEPRIDLFTEYLDSQRMVEKDNLSRYRSIFFNKYRHIRFNLIVASDDAAFQFLLQYGSTIFPGTPVVFCGVNDFNASILERHPLFTGTVEKIDIRKTLIMALKLHPGTRTVYYLNDDTITGKATESSLRQVMDYFQGRLKFIPLSGRNLDEISAEVRMLPKNSIILYLMYSRDAYGRFHPFQEGIYRVAKSSKIPIYGVWDVYLGKGIVGGLLASGFYQGEAAAKIGLRILHGAKPRDIAVKTAPGNQYEFDYFRLKQFGIPLAALPQGSVIINHESATKRQILYLNSYHEGSTWEGEMNEGIRKVLANKAGKLDIIYEYLDLMRHPDPVYRQQVYSFLKDKYSHQKFDLIIAADDEAFRFISLYRNEICPDAPVVFCGVNYFEDRMIKGIKGFTGVVESYDLKKTIDLGLKLHQGVKRVVVINDTTLNGISNRKNLERIIPAYHAKVAWEYWEDYDMPFIQKVVAHLPKNTIILLLAFSRDKANHIFSYEEAVSQIAKYAAVPIYGVWDFYLGHGLLGGRITGGVEQGEAAGKMALQILNGKDPDTIKVMRHSPSEYSFDYRQMKRFGVKMRDLPAHSTIINLPLSFSQFYKDHRHWVLKGLLIFLAQLVAFLIIIVFLLFRNIKIRKKSEEKAKIYATTDPLTGIYNRRAGLERLLRCLHEAERNAGIFSICFIDVNGLKHINDTYGHQEGDRLIKTVVKLVCGKIRSIDCLCRFGGDEFLLILPQVAAEQARTIWKRIQEEFDTFNRQAGCQYTVSASAGFAQYFPDKPRTVHELIEQADNEMYQNKAAYKKQSAVSPNEGPIF